MAATLDVARRYVGSVTSDSRGTCYKSKKNQDPGRNFGRTLVWRPHQSILISFKPLEVTLECTSSLLPRRRFRLLSKLTLLGAAPFFNSPKCLCYEGYSRSALTAALNLVVCFLFLPLPSSSSQRGALDAGRGGADTMVQMF
jgi:hypothetical protein